MPLSSHGATARRKGKSGGEATLASEGDPRQGKRMRIHRFLSLSLACTIACVSATHARDHVLTIGGGYSPAGNQISLERNVVFFNKLLAEQLPSDTAHDLYFADGKSPNPDLQFEPKEVKIPKANLLAAALFGSTKNIKLEYRNNELKDVRGASSPSEVEAWFKDTGSKLVAGDRLILYITAHGGRGHKDKKHNTKIFMWNNQSLEASKLAEHIAGLPEGVSVVTVMVQCYSGGFANLIFDGADPKKAEAKRSICGFYATVQDRVAAGCTPDINEEDYDEYSSHFWAALRGKNRVERDVTKPDYDGDGAVSFEEAHAFTMISSHSLDIPIKTSGAFLRRHSKMEEKDKPDLLHAEKTPYFELLTHARPADLAALDALSARLGLTSAKRGEEARKKAEEVSKKRKELQDKSKEKKKTIDAHRREISRDLKNRWPQFTNQFSPGAIAIIRDQPDEFVKAAESHPKFKEWTKLNKERGKLEAESFELEKRWAHHKRFTRILENVALAANLDQLTKPEVVSKYQQLAAAEGSPLVAPKPAPPVKVASEESKKDPEKEPKKEPEKQKEAEAEKKPEGEKAEVTPS